MQNAIVTPAAEQILSKTYAKEQLQSLPVADQQRLARIEGSQFPEEVKAALRARTFGDFGTADRIRAAVPHLFTRVNLEPLRSTIPNLSKPALMETTIALRNGKAVH
jgi:hypothetical protein